MAAPALAPADQVLRLQLELRACEQRCDAMRSEAASAGAEALSARAQLAALAEESGTASALARRTIQEREQALLALRAQHEELQGRYSTDTSALRSEALEAAVLHDRAFKGMEEELRLQLKEANFQVERGSLFMEQKAALEGQVEALQTQLAADASRYQVQMTEMERRFITEKLGIERTFELKRDTIEHTAKEAALASLTADQRRVLRENEGLGGEVVHLSVQTRKLTHSLQGLSLEKGTLQREVKDLQSAEGAWAQRCAQQSLKAKALEARLQEAQAAAAAAAAAQAAAREQQQARFAKESEALRVECLGLRSLLEHKNRELASVKRLAGIVLAQRTEVEHFFLDALTLVKLQVLRRKRAAAAAAVAGEAGEAAEAAAGARRAAGSSKEAVAALHRSKGAGAAATALAGSSSSSRSGEAEEAGAVLGLSGLKAHQQFPILTPVPGVDLYDLTAEDRESVLRALFQHLQQGEGAARLGEAQGPVGSARSPASSSATAASSSSSAAAAAAAAAAALATAGEAEASLLSRPIGVLSDAQLSP
jgi:hypothetical protein